MYPVKMGKHTWIQSTTNYICKTLYPVELVDNEISRSKIVHVWKNLAPQKKT